MREARMHVQDCECLDATGMGGPAVTDPCCAALDDGPEAPPVPLAPDDLITWLRAQLDDDERVAREATAGPWHVAGVTELGSADVHAAGAAVTSAYAEPCCSIDDAEHIAHWDPARVLAEVEAKRRILDIWKRWNPDIDPALVAEQTRINGFVLDGIIRLLAQPYADRPGWRAEWAT